MFSNRKSYIVVIAVLFFCSCNHFKISKRQPTEVLSSQNLRPELWHGFNLLNMFWKNWKDGPFQERDFELIHKLGFNYVRIPLDYRVLIEDSNWLILREDKLRNLDDAVEWGSKYKIHVTINLHRAPGYIVDPKDPEKYNLWKDKVAQDAFLNFWKKLANRYKGVSRQDLSFNLVNEPSHFEQESFERIIRETVQAIREIDPLRPVILDGVDFGKKPIPSMAQLAPIQSTRGYSPFQLLSWTPKLGQPSPTWPSAQFNRQWLIDFEITPWLEMEKKGVLVFVGEFGARNTLPHDFVLAWMDEQLSLWKESHWGWALWNLYGEHGIFDSDRKDVVYEDFEGHKLDRKMLNLLQKYKE